MTDEQMRLERERDKTTGSKREAPHEGGKEKIGPN